MLQVQGPHDPFFGLDKDDVRGYRTARHRAKIGLLVIRRHDKDGLRPDFWNVYAWTTWASSQATRARELVRGKLQDGEDADNVVRVTGKECLSIGGPGERETLGVGRVLADAGELGLELVDDAL